MLKAFGSLRAAKPLSKVTAYCPRCLHGVRDSRVSRTERAICDPRSDFPAGAERRGARRVNRSSVTQKFGTGGRAFRSFAAVEPEFPLRQKGMLAARNWE